MSKPLRFGRAVTVMLAFALGLRTREFGKSNEVRWSFGDVTKKQISSPKGPLAHPEEQETFNLKVPGSRPGRPTKCERLSHANPFRGAGTQRGEPTRRVLIEKRPLRTSPRRGAAEIMRVTARAMVFRPARRRGSEFKGLSHVTHDVS